MKCHVPLLATVLLTLMSCTAAPSKPILSGKGGSTSDSFPGKPDSPKDSGVATENRAAPAEPSAIELENTKFAGEEAKLEAVVKYSGLTSERLKFTTASDKATLTVPGLPAKTPDTLIIEIYEKDKLRFVAKRANTLVELDKSNIVSFADCAITKVPWDGEANEATCGWSIEASK